MYNIFKKCIPNFQIKIKSASRCNPHIACWVAELNTKAKKWKYKFKQIFHHLQWGSNPQPVYLTVTPRDAAPRLASFLIFIFVNRILKKVRPIPLGLSWFYPTYIQNITTAIPNFETLTGNQAHIKQRVNGMFQLLSAWFGNIVHVAGLHSSYNRHRNEI